MSFHNIFPFIEEIISPKQLSKAQKIVLYYCWQDLSYLEISKITDYEFGYVKELGAKIWQILSQGTGEKITKKNFRTIITFYAKKKNYLPSENLREYWTKKLETKSLYGRKKELNILNQWVFTEQSRLIAICGMVGIGKSILTTKLVQGIKGEFDYFYWQSLQEPLELEDFLDHLIVFLGHDKTNNLKTIKDKALIFQKYLIDKKCLIVLDGFESLFELQKSNGIYQKKYAEYKEFLLNIGQTAHQSCVIVTSREIPNEVCFMKGGNSSVRLLILEGLDQKASLKLLHLKGLKHLGINKLNLIKEYYLANPLFLKITTSSICTLYAGNLNMFSGEYMRSCSIINELLKNTISRLSELEKKLMYLVAINIHPISLTELRAQLCPNYSEIIINEAIYSLRMRLLMDLNQEQYTEKDLIMDYIIDNFIDNIFNDIKNKTFKFLDEFVLVNIHSNEDIQKIQQSKIVEPLIERINEYFPKKIIFKEHCQEILQKLIYNDQINGYAAENLINLCFYLSLEIKEFNFGNLAIRQAKENG